MMILLIITVIFVSWLVHLLLNIIYFSNCLKRGFIVIDNEYYALTKLDRDWCNKVQYYKIAHQNPEAISTLKELLKEESEKC